MYCPSCGARCSPESIACHACGAILPGLTEVVSRAAAPPVGIPPTSDFSAVNNPTAQRPAARNASETPSDPVPSVQTAAPGSWSSPQLGRPGELEQSAHNWGTPASSSPHLPPAPYPPPTFVPPSPYGQAPQAAPAPHAAPYAPAAAYAPQPVMTLTHPADGRLLGRVKLVVEQGKILGEQFLLGDVDISIGRYDAGTGRCPDIDLTAQDPAYVHRQHARITFTPDGRSLILHDMGGRNGCYVNNQLLDKNGSAPVRLGDKVRIGRVVMRLQPATELEKEPQRK